MAHYQQVQRGPGTSDEYYVHVTNLEKKTSMCDGPHFPKTFRNKKPLQNSNGGGGQGKMSTTAGRFGRAEHVEYEISETSCEEDVEVDGGEYVKRSQYDRRVVKSA